MNGIQTNNLSACPQCDLLLQNVLAPPNHTTSCPRCGCVIRRNHSGSLEKTLALAITGLLLYVPAIFLPLITLKKLGMSEQANVLDTIIHFYESGYYFVSAMTLMSAAFMPLCLLGMVVTIALQLKRGKASARTARIFRYYIHLEEWAMVEVYLFGILVTIFKMADGADIIYNIGFFAFIVLVFIALGISVVMDKALFWELLEQSTQDSPGKIDNSSLSSSVHSCKHTAATAGYASCLTCNKLAPLDKVTAMPPSHCDRCGEHLHLRKPGSISRTLALTLTSAVLFIPANILPIMDVKFLGVSDKATILDGILLFLEDGSYLIGLIILIASILVPLFKIIGLTILTCTTSFRFSHFLRQKTAMFRVITFIGRWSMLDIFVIALLISLVDFGFFTTIQVAPAATFFCIVVAATMLAANTFDPRIMWDTCYPEKKENDTP
ncbi:PqiA/YebS family transporter subunit [Desulfosediminicola flagellatus]|uniref:paraquat-inducible protein A n=1 Tax=Desulfosediminicola flagellatus TaxID=2569541 RepID=UPI0010AD7EF4|nr:PqiA/YebS family transporter subunit [Desulfosediminicola flagellatus]